MHICHGAGSRKECSRLPSGHVTKCYTGDLWASPADASSMPWLGAMLHACAARPAPSMLFNPCSATVSRLPFNHKAHVRIGRGLTHGRGPLAGDPAARRRHCAGPDGLPRRRRPCAARSCWAAAGSGSAATHGQRHTLDRPPPRAAARGSPGTARAALAHGPEWAAAGRGCRRALWLWVPPRAAAAAWAWARPGQVRHGLQQQALQEGVLLVALRLGLLRVQRQHELQGRAGAQREHTSLPHLYTRPWWHRSRVRTIQQGPRPHQPWQALQLQPNPHPAAPCGACLH